MLKRLRLKDFTLFEKADLRLGSLNVFVGENGTGKTHILKAAYCGLMTAASPQSVSGAESWSWAARSKLIGVFRPDDLTSLIRRGERRADVFLDFDDPQLDFRYSIQGSSLGVQPVPDNRLALRPLYFPPKEMLSVAPGFVSMYETLRVPFEETWRDAIILLQAPLLRHLSAESQRILDPLEKVLGGPIEMDESGRFRVRLRSGPMEIQMVAEGLRKIGMVARLLATGALRPGAALFWDEPEANLNPRLVKLAARTIVYLTTMGVQIFVATHSNFLLRELYILSLGDFKGLQMRCFGLRLKRGGGVTIQQGPTIDDIGAVAALDEELEQSDRYLDTQYVGTGR